MCDKKAYLPCSSVWSGWIKSANSMSSRALNTSEAEMLLCCLEVETSCALRSITVFHITVRATSFRATYVAATRTFWSEKAVRRVESPRSKKHAPR